MWAFLGGTDEAHQKLKNAYRRRAVSVIQAIVSLHKYTNEAN